MIARAVLAAVLLLGPVQCQPRPTPPARPIMDSTYAPLVQGIHPDTMGCYLSSDNAEVAASPYAGCVVNNGVWTVHSSSCTNTDCTVHAKSRTAQIVYGMGGYRRPWVDGGRVGVNVGFRVTAQARPASVTQFVVVWLALRDTRGTADRDDDIRMWYAVTLYDSRSRDITAFPPVISDWYAGGGTPFMNALGYLDGPASRGATQLPGTASTFSDGGGQYRFTVRAEHVRQAITDANALIASDPIYDPFPPYSTDLANIELRAVAVDVEVNDRTMTGPIDYLTYTVAGFQLTQTGGAQ